VPLILKQKDGQNNEKQQLPKRRGADVPPTVGTIQQHINTPSCRELYTSGTQFHAQQH
jgi:hypothetical protein